MATKTPARHTPAAHKPAQLTSCVTHSKPVYVGRPGADFFGRWGLVEINGTYYWVRPHGKTSRDGFQLVNLDNENIYDVDTSTGFPVCDCPDYEVRRGKGPNDGCKHCLALMKMRDRGDI